MKYLFSLLIIIASSVTQAQKPEIIKLNRLQQLLENKSDNIQIINFWATWCAPCVNELPLFEKLNSEKPLGVKITLVSMDMDLDPNPEKVFKFVERKKIQSEVFVLDERNPNAWIDTIDKSWSGALPATIIIN